MNVNKKLGRFKQWAGERMGGEIRTNVSDDFKTLEMEMALRYEGLKKNHQAMNDYVKAMSNKLDGPNKEKQLPIAALGSTMAMHSDDFEIDSEFGQCLGAIGRANERLARLQETYTQKASSTWLDSLDRSMAQHKELAKSRKKLDDRRLGYDTAAAKMAKLTKDDFRAEEELRSSRAKYEETNEDVQRRMMDIKEMEADSIEDLTDFLDAQVAYFEKCRELLLQVKRDWPATNASDKRLTRSRSNTSGSIGRRFDTVEEEPALPPLQPPRPAFSSSRHVSNSLPQSPVRELQGFDLPNRPKVNRSSTYDGVRRDTSPASLSHSAYRLPSDSSSIRNQRSQLRSVSQTAYEDFSESPTNSTGSSFTDQSYLSSISVAKKKPPPPPPSRASKPPPPLPPVRNRTLQEV